MIVEDRKPQLVLDIGYRILDIGIDRFRSMFFS